MTLVVVAIAVALIAIAWACAWQTMNWLGDAEDLIERAAADDAAELAYAYRQRIDVDLWAQLRRYKRRTPKRST